MVTQRDATPVAPALSLNTTRMGPATLSHPLRSYEMAAGAKPTATQRPRASVFSTCSPVAVATTRQPDFQSPAATGATWTCAPRVIASLRASSSAETRSVPAARRLWLASADDSLGIATKATIATMMITTIISTSVKPCCERHFMEERVSIGFPPTSSPPANGCRRCRSTAPDSGPATDHSVPSR